VTLSHRALLFLLGALAPAWGCASTRVVPNEVADFCPKSSSVQVADEGTGRQSWPEAAFSKDAPSDPTRFPECEPGDTSEKCKVRVPAGHWDRFIYWGEPPVTAFKGIVYRWVIRSSHGGPKVLRINHAEGKTLLTVRAIENLPDQDRAYWTWTRLRELTPAEWATVQKRIEEADVWNVPTPPPPEERVYRGKTVSLEVYDGTRYETIGSRSNESQAFRILVELVESYAKCPER
jgi:hypothetical protein